MEERFFLYDDTVATKLVSLALWEKMSVMIQRYYTPRRHYGKTIVLDMQRNKFAIIGADDLNEPGYLEHAFSMTEEIAEELRSFLFELI